MLVLCCAAEFSRKIPPKDSAKFRSTVASTTFRGEHARLTESLCSLKQHKLVAKAKTNTCSVESRWLGLIGAAAPDGARLALRVRQQRHAVFALGLLGYHVIDAEAWRKTARIKIPDQGRSDKLSPRECICAHVQTPSYSRSAR